MSEYVDLITDSGELIRIECPDEHSDALYDSLEHSMKRGDWWSPRMFDGCKAEFLGLPMSRISMKKVIGLL
ncbi:MAG: hypothetical protein COA78_11990 [Blastopirellula sp.]|nr:MAG: hypothetical protein COA78_11990 [Blastopirellula sp.]